MAGETFKRNINESLDLELTIRIIIVLQEKKVGIKMNEGEL